jgi:hypothetical protein
MALKLWRSLDVNNKREVLANTRDEGSCQWWRQASTLLLQRSLSCLEGASCDGTCALQIRYAQAQWISSVRTRLWKMRDRRRKLAESWAEFTTNVSNLHKLPKINVSMKSVRGVNAYWRVLLKATNLNLMWNRNDNSPDECAACHGLLKK